MKHLAAIALLALALACGKAGETKPVPDKNPVSLRGWVEDIEGGGQGMERTPETELARRSQLFQSINLWVEKAEFVSGGIAQNGAFILLDVPPGNVTVSFATAGAESARLTMANIPAGADVLVPGVMLRNGEVKIVDPKALVVRLPGSVSKPEDTGDIATIGGHPVRVIRAPMKDFLNRRDYPEPGGLRTVATYR